MLGAASCSSIFLPSSKDIIYIKDIMDKKSFQKIGHYYAKDKNHVYCNFQVNETTASHAETPVGHRRKFVSSVPQYFLIKGADPKTFKVMENPEFSHDENHVYYVGFLIEGADVKSFQLNKN